jgi:beta-lactamase regulating signal transducer with metallopeptidase domain
MTTWAHQGVWFLTVASIDLCVLAAIVWIANFVGARWRPATRQLLWGVVIVKPTVVLVAAIAGASLLPVTDLSADRFLGVMRANDLTASAAALLTSGELVVGGVMAIWAVGFLVSWASLLGGVVAGNRLIERAREYGLPLSPRFVRRLGIRAPADIEVIVSPDVSSPGTWGLRRGVVLVPFDWLPIQENGRIAPDDAVALRHVLQHELGHVRRRDGLRQFLLRACATPLWFHPFVYLAMRWWLEAVEASVDHCVLRDQRNDPTQYARTLIAAVRRSQPEPSAAGVWFLGQSRRSRVRSLHRRLQKVLTPAQRMPWISRVTSTGCAVAVITSLPLTMGTLHPSEVTIAADAPWITPGTTSVVPVGLAAPTDEARRSAVIAYVDRYFTSVWRDGHRVVYGFRPEALLMGPAASPEAPERGPGVLAQGSAGQGVGPSQGLADAPAAPSSSAP